MKKYSEMKVEFPAPSEFLRYSVETFSKFTTSRIIPCKDYFSVENITYEKNKPLKIVPTYSFGAGGTLDLLNTKYSFPIISNNEILNEFYLPAKYVDYILGISLTHRFFDTEISIPYDYMKGSLRDIKFINMLLNKHKTEKAHVFNLVLLPIFIEGKSVIHSICFSLYKDISFIYKCPLCNVGFEKNINDGLVQRIKENKSKSYFTLKEVGHSCSLCTNTDYIIPIFKGIRVNNVFVDKYAVLSQLFSLKGYTSVFASIYVDEHKPINKKENLTNLSLELNSDLFVGARYSSISFLLPFYTYLIVNDFLIERLFETNPYLKFILFSKVSSKD